jgi:O-antigen ligase/Tfp pilus assembly protein PilF
LLLVHLVLSPLVFWQDTVEAFEYNKVVVLSVTAIALAALGLSSWIRNRLAPRPGNWSGTASLAAARGLCREPIALGVLLFLLSAALSTATSLSPRTSFFGAHESYAGLGTVAAYTVLFFATRALCRSFADGRRLLVGVVVGTAGAASYALVQAAGADPLPWANVSQVGTYARPFATLGHPNFLAAYLVLTFPLVADCARRAAESRRWWLLVTLGAVGALSGLAILLALSRGAWLAFAGMLAVLVGGWWGGGARRGAAVCLCPLVLAVLGFAGAVRFGSGGEQLLDRVADRVQRLGESAGRQHLWRAGLGLFRDRPLIGCGLDAFQLAFPAQRTAAFWQVEWNVTPAKAHNEAIHILATQGLAGAAAVSIFTAGLFLTGRRAWRRAAPAERPLLVAVAAGLVGFYLQAAFSFTVAACGTLFVTLAALLSRWGGAAAAAGAGPLPRAPRRLWPALLHLGVWVSAAGLLAAGVVWPYRANLACRAGDRLLGEEPRRAVACFERATRLDPSKELYWVQLGAGAQLAARSAPVPAERRQLLLLARHAFERALHLVPVNVFHHANLGRLLGELAREGLAAPGQAFAAFDAALAADRYNAYFYVDAATTALVLGDGARARAYATRGLDVYPHFGPLRAQLGYLALLEKRPDEAAGLLDEALRSDWYGDGDGHRVAAAALRSAVRARRE